MLTYVNYVPLLSTMNTKTKANKRTVGRPAADKKVRVTLLLTDGQLDKVQQAQGVFGFGDKAAAVRYLMNRGLESCSTQMEARKLFDQYRSELQPQQLLDLFKEVGR